MVCMVNKVVLSSGMFMNRYRYYFDKKMFCRDLPWGIKESMESDTAFEKRIFERWDLVMEGASDDFVRGCPENDDNDVNPEQPYQHCLSYTRANVYRTPWELWIFVEAHKLNDLDKITPVDLTPGTGGIINVAISPGPDPSTYSVFGINDSEDEISGWKSVPAHYCEVDGEKVFVHRGVHTEGLQEKISRDYTKNFRVMESKEATTWRVAFFLPFETLGTTPELGDTWRINFERIVWGIAEICIWSNMATWSPVVEHWGYLIFDQEPTSPHIRRVDIDFDEETETGELTVTTAGDMNSATLEMKVVGERMLTPCTPLAEGKQTFKFRPRDGLNLIQPRIIVEHNRNHPPADMVDVPFVYHSSSKLVIPPNDYPKLKISLAEKLFWSAHEGMEKTYNGDGSWGKGYGGGLTEKQKKLTPFTSTHPLCRQSSAAVIGYTIAYRVLGKEDIFLDRIREGSQWLVKQQMASGGMPWFKSEDKPDDGTGGAYETGWAGEALMFAYEMTHEESFLQASRKAVQWYYSHCGVDYNTNYNAFAVSHLAEYYRITSEEKALRLLAHYLEYGVLPAQTLEGRWPGHNIFGCYADITVKALAKALRAIGKKHPLYPATKRSALRAINSLLTDQMPDGRFEQRSCRSYGKYDWAGLEALIEVATSLSLDVRPALNGVAQYYKDGLEGKPGLPLTSTAKLIAYLKEMD